MSEEVRWGVLGAARIAADRALPALCALPDTSLEAVASRDRARAASLAERFGAPGAYGDYAELLADPAVDAVYVALPNALHTQWVLAALDHGKAVLCEKPLAYRTADAEKVARLSEATGLLAADGFMYRFHPQTERLFELVADGAVGEPRTARGALSFRLANGGDIRADPALGGGCLLDLGCYPVDALCRLYGGPAIGASGRRMIGASGIDEVTVVVLEFGGGRIGTVEASFRQHWTESLFEVRGEDGTLRAPYTFNPGRSAPTMTLLKPGADPIHFSSPGTDMFAMMFAAFGAAVRGVRPYPFPVSDLVSVATSLELASAVPVGGR